MAKNYKAAILITGDNSGGVKAIKATRQQIDGLNKSVDNSGKSFKSYTSRTNASTKALNSLKEQAKLAAGAVGLGLLVDRAVKAADTMTQLNARLELATDTTAQFQEAQSRLIEISRNTYTAIDTNVTLYSRMAIATKDLAIDQETLFKATESLQNSFRAYGTSTEEAASATLQLTQAMAKGKLDGDEFRSVMENAPLVMTALTKELNITKKELFEFSRTGRLQVQDLVAALANSADEFAAQSAKIPQTISEAFTGLNREFTLMVGNADKAISASTLITKSINLLANNLELLVTGVGLRLLAPMIGQIGATAALTTKSIGLFGTGLVTVNARAALATKTMAGLNKAMALVGGPAGLALLGGYAAWTGINALIDARNDKLERLSEVSETAARAIDDFNNSVAGSAQEAQSLNTIAAEIENLKNKIAELNEEQARNYAGAEFGYGRVMGGPAIQNAQDQIDGAEAQIALLEQFQKFGGIVKTATDGMNSLGEAYVWLVDKGNELQANLTGQVESVDKWIESQQEQLASLQKQNEYFNKSAEQVLLLEAAKQKLLTTDDEQRKKIDTLTAAIIKETKALDSKEKALAAQNKAIEEQNEFVEYAIELTEKHATVEEQLAQISADQLSAIEAATNAQSKLSEKGLTLEEVLEAINAEAAEQIKQLLGLDKATDDLRNGYSDLIAEYEREIDILNASGDARDRLIAAQELERRGIEATAENVANLVAKYNELTQAQQRASMNAGVSGAFGSLFGGDFDGFLSGLDGVLNQASDNIGDAIVQGFRDGYAQGGGMSGGLSGAAGGASNALAAVPVIGWIYAGMKLNDRLFADGWRTNDNDFDYGTATAVGALFGNSLLPALTQVADRLFQSLGMSERMASLLSGSAIMTRLFGRKAPEIEQQGIRIGTSAGGYTGEAYANILREGGLFRSDQRYTETGALSDEVASVFNDIIEIIQVRMGELGEAFGTEAGGIVEASFEQVFDAEGELIDSFSTFFGRVYKESAEQFASRLASESTIAYLDTLIEQVVGELSPPDDLGGGGSGGGGPIRGDGRLFDDRKNAALIGQVTLAAEAYRASSESLAEFTDAATSMVHAMVEGDAIFDMFADNLAITEELANAGETLNETWGRLLTQNELLTQASTVMGVELDLAAGEFTRFADEIVAASGGLERSAQLWENYFSNFFSQDELAEIQLGQSSDLLAQQAGNLGLDADMTMAEFRQLFNEQMPNLTAEQIAQWLEFAETLVRVTDLEEQRTAALQAELEALQAYNDFAASITDQIAELTGNGASEFEQRIAEIDSGLQSNIDSLYELAAAAGLAEPAQEDLSNAYRLAALQTAEAIGLLRDATQSLIDELYGDQAQSQVDQFSNSFQSGISNVSQAGSNLFSQWESALQRIDDYTNSLLTNEQLSPLEAPERLAQARADFYDLVAAANAGDIDAAAQVQPAMQEFLQILRDVERSGEDYNSEFYAAIAAAQGITAPTGGGETVTVGPSQGYIDYTNQQREQDAAAMAAHRLELSQALAEHVSQLAQAINQPVLELFTDMGGDIEQFLVDLGIDVGEATGETTAMLANLAETLNIEVTELADHVGLSLGSLADAQSLLNDGLEFTINSLPDGIQNTLEPLLRDVENAADGTQQEAALAALETATAGLPAEYRNALAPYFDNIDPTSELAQQVTELQDQTRWLTAIARNTAAQNDAAGLPSYDVGTPFVPKDQIAQIHKGEMIIPAREAGILRGMGVNVTPQSNADVVAELRAVKAELKSMKAMQRGKFDESITVQGQIRDEAGKDKNPPTPIQPRQIKGVCSG